MINKINIYIRRKTNRTVSNTLKASIEGFRVLGLDFQVLYEDEYRPSDIAVLYGYHKKVSGAGVRRKQIYDTQKKLGNKILVFERGFLNRELYHSVGWNGINGRADFVVKDKPADRFNQLNIKTKEYKKGREPILLCGQVPWDANVQTLNTGNKKKISSVGGYMKWLNQTYTEIRANTARDIIFRPHPKFMGRQDWYKVAIPETIEWSVQNIKKDFKRCSTCVVFSSNTAVEAVMEGLSIYVGDIGSMAYPIANKDFSKIDNPINLDREQWLYDLAYKQWTWEEISRGKFWEHLL